MFTETLIEKFKTIATPFYYYDLNRLNHTLQTVKTEATKYGYSVHYAMKANANPTILKHICKSGFGADCVSGNEVKRAIECGFPASEVVFAGVGKSDPEINLALDNDIFCFNSESVQELEVINELAQAKGKTARIALRINPNIDAHTHAYITTGLEENKFGINLWEVESVIERMKTLDNLKLIGIHFHIGSQITELEPFKELCDCVNELQTKIESYGIQLENINVGGGLGVDYHNPDDLNSPDFESYFKLFNENLKLRPNQQLHFELGRALVAQCSALITKVLYTKKCVNTTFAIVDAGMSDLIRPALYQAYHKIENITSKGENQLYDVVGPICESSDTFGKAVEMPQTQRGDLIAIRTAGAYGEIMASQYNLRDIPKAVFVV